MKIRHVKIRFRDLDWRVLLLLVFMMIVTPVDDIVLFPIGQALDPLEILVNVFLSYVLGKKAMRRAMEREGEVVPGRVVDGGAGAPPKERG